MRKRPAPFLQDTHHKHPHPRVRCYFRIFLRRCYFRNFSKIAFKLSSKIRSGQPVIAMEDGPRSSIVVPRMVPTPTNAQRPYAYYPMASGAPQDQRLQSEGMSLITHTHIITHVHVCVHTLLTKTSLPRRRKCFWPWIGGIGDTVCSIRLGG